MSVPELVIPLRFDVKKIPGQLAAVGAAGKAAGTQTAKGMQVAQTATDKLGISMVGLMKAQMGLAAVRKVGETIKSEFRESADYVMKTAKEFQALRKTMQEVATLRGVSNSNKFTLDEAKAAQQASLTPQERRDMQAEFLNFAGAQIGPGPDKKLTDAQAQDYSSRVATLMKSFGYAPSAGMNLAGTLLQQKKGPQNVDQLMEELSVGFQVAEKGQVSIGRASPDLAQLMASGMSLKEAAMAYAVISPAAPNKEIATSEAAFRAIEEMQVEGKEGQFGVNNKMTRYESLKAFGMNISGRMDKNIAAGMSEEEAQIQVAKDLKEAGVAGDIRERRGVISGAARSGARLGGFANFEAIAAATPKDFEAQRKKLYTESAQGIQDLEDANTAVSEAQEGERHDKLMLLRQRAETSARDKKLFETPSVDKMIRAAIPFSDPVREQMVNVEALRMARTPEQNADKDLVEAQNMIAANTEATNVLLERMLKNQTPALAAPPAGGGGVNARAGQ